MGLLALMLVPELMRSVVKTVNHKSKAVSQQFCR